MATFEKAAVYEDLSDNSFVEQYRFTREDGKLGRLYISPSRANQWTVMASAMRDKGAAAVFCKKDLILAVVAQPPKKRFTYAAHTGWQANNSGFALQHRAIGLSSRNIRGISPNKCVLETADRRARGSSQRWRELVARMGNESTAIMFAISAAFAAPLLRWVGEESFAICLFGKTRGGKTAACLAGESVAGVGNADKLLSWNATEAGLRPALASHNDLLLVIDDLNKLPSSSYADKYRQIKEFSYNLAAGSNRRRSRMHADTNENGSQYRLITLTSSEESIQSLALKANVQRSGGDAVRLIDVPAYYGELEHIFDKVDGAVGAEALQNRYAQLKQACSDNHGYIFWRYIRYLLRNNQDCTGSIRRWQSSFIQHVAPSGNRIELTDLARKFSIIFAGGMMAVESVGLDWHPDDVLETISRCYQGAADTLFPERLLLKSGRLALKTWLMNLPKIDGLDAKECGSIDGYVSAAKRSYICTVKIDSFNRVFDNVPQRELVLAELEAQGQITLAAKTDAARRGPKEQFKWPDEKRRRSYRISWKRKQ